MSQDAVRANNEAFMEAVRDGDAAGVAPRYTEDCVLLPSGAPRIDGRAGVEAFFAEGLKQGIRDIRLETTEVEEVGDALQEIGRALVTVETPDGQTIEDPGKYVVIYRRDGDDWRMHVDIWNSDQAPGG